jgi:hypothetical protein
MRVWLSFLILTLGFFFYCGHSASAASGDSDDVAPTGLTIGAGEWISPTVSGVTKSGRGSTEFSLNSNLIKPR